MNYIVNRFCLERSFFQAAVVSILLYGCTTWTLTKRLEKKLDGNYTRMLRAVLNKSWRQHPTRTIQVRRTRHAGHCWRSKDELISDVLLWTPTYDRAKAGRPARTYIQQLCEDTGCNPEGLSETMNDRLKWRERVRDIRAGGTTWWWWYCKLNYHDQKIRQTIRVTYGTTGQLFCPYEVSSAVYTEISPTGDRTGDQNAEPKLYNGPPVHIAHKRCQIN